MAQQIGEAFPTLHGNDGLPLENGKVYIGTSGLNAETNQIQVYWDVALTSPATQPIRTVGGRLRDENGAVARVYVGTGYAMTVKTSADVLVFSADVAAPTFAVVSDNETVSGDWDFTGDVDLSGATVTLPAAITAQPATTISATDSVEIILNKSGSTFLSRLWGYANNIKRWAIDLGDATAESGSNAGSDLAFKGFNDAGGLLGDALKIVRSTFQAIFYGEIAMANDSPIAWDVGPNIRGGSGTPEGNVSAPVGSLYFRSDGGASTSLYVKESGSGNTGWVAK